MNVSMYNSTFGGQATLRGRNSWTFQLDLIKRSRVFRHGKTLKIRSNANDVVQGSGPKSVAEAAVEKGLSLFEQGDASAALEEFLRAEASSPTNDEALAAIYNAACAYTKLNRWKEASDALVRAINEYDLKLIVALKDPDLAPLRDRREWNAALEKVAGGITSEGYAKLKAEASAPFRLIRLFLFGGLASGAGLGLLVSVGRLAAAIGGSGDLKETSTTFGINIASFVILGYLFNRERSAQKSGIDTAAKEEELAMLQVRVSKSGNRSVPLSAFRAMYRPLVIAGSKGQVTKSLQKAASLKQQLVSRGVVVIPVILNDQNVDANIQRLKEEMKGEGSKGFAPSTSSTQASSVDEESESDDSKKWKLEPYQTEEWKQWLKKFGIDDTGAMTEVYAQVQLDGVVRASGAGSPPFEKLISDIPVLDSWQTKLTDGRGMQ